MYSASHTAAVESIREIYFWNSRLSVFCGVEYLPVNTDFGADYDVKTVRDMGWPGKKNGELLGLIVFNGFDFFVTIDKNLRHQQNPDHIEIKIFLLLAINNRRDTLQGLVRKIKDTISEGNLKK